VTGKKSYGATEAVLGAKPNSASELPFIEKNVRKEQPFFVVGLLGFSLATTGCLNLGTVDGSTTFSPNETKEFPLP
jgi:hypothetical protein